MPAGRRIYWLVGLILAFIITGLWQPDFLYASTPGQQQEQPLRVVTKEIEPFVIKDGERLTGFSIDLWEEIALITGLPFELVEVETVGDQLAAVVRGEADVAIAAISMTPEREERLDFSYPYFRSGLQIMTSSQYTAGLFPIVALMTSPRFLYGVGGTLLILLAIGHFAWFIERKQNPDFAHSYRSGIWDGLWWAAVTVTTVGYGDKVVRDVPGRILGIFWMFAGIFLIANFTAFVTTELTVSRLNATITGVEDLKGMRVATVVGTTSADYLKEQGIPFRDVEVVEDAYRLLENGRVDAIVFDAPVLQYYAATEGNGEVEVVGSPFQREDYGIALPPGSLYEERINQALLEIKVSGTYDEIAKQWFIAE